MTLLTFSNIAVAALCALLPWSAAAQDLSADGTSFTFSGGLNRIRAGEFVFDKRRMESELDWRADSVPTFTFGLDQELPHDFYLKAEITGAFAGNGFMADYDWLTPSDAWSDRSVHPATVLDHFWEGRFEAGRSFERDAASSFRLGAGLQYTDVQWTASGGSFIYTYDEFRDTPGTIDAGTRVVTYRQRWPVGYLAASFEHADGAITWGAGLRAGAAVGGFATDRHWQTGFLFRDDFYAASYLALTANAEYGITDSFAIYLRGTMEGMMRVRADDTERDLLSGGVYREKNTTGGSFSSMSLAFGLKGRF